jgi:hypothetical protein
LRLTLIAAVVVFLVCASVEAQTSVTLKATVSETVAVSVVPTFSNGNVVSSGNTVQIRLSGTNAESPVIRVPLLVRSNSNFKISAIFESQTAVLDQLSVTDVHATGNLVSPQAVHGLDVRRAGDVDISRPLLVLSGPRISLGGTLASPNNALKVTLLIRLKPQTATDWTAHLTLVGTAGSLTQ